MKEFCHKQNGFYSENTEKTIIFEIFIKIKRSKAPINSQSTHCKTLFALSFDV